MSEHGTMRSQRHHHHKQQQQHQHQQSRSSHHRDRERHRDRGDQPAKPRSSGKPRSVKLTQASRHNSQRSVNFGQSDNNKLDLDTNNNTDGNEGEDEAGQQHIRVQIIPQDDNWGEANTTAHTAANSEFSDYNEDAMTEDGRSCKDMPFGVAGNSYEPPMKYSSPLRLLSRYYGCMGAILIVLCTYVTPLLFIALPRMALRPNGADWTVNECGIECEALLIGIAFKLFLLLLGAWALYMRKPKASMPRVYEMRALIMFLLCILSFSFWLFYGVRVIETRQSDYYKILQFAVSYLDVLLFIYLISVILIEVRHLQPQYVISVSRSPDGIERQYHLGSMSIQRAAVFILEQYYKDFPVYNPWLENVHKRRVAHLEAMMKSKAGGGSVKHYSIDGDGDYDGDDKKSVKSQMLALTAAKGQNDRFYEECEYERRLKKRKARLLTATEDAFGHIRRVQKDQCAQTVMDPLEAAQAIFTSIARELRRYLRITRQQPYFTRESIVRHLGECISYDMSPKTFLQRYMQTGDEALVFNERAMCFSSNPAMLASANSKEIIKGKTPEQSWILISDTVLYQNVEDNLMFVLKQSEISLMCSFKRLPHFNLIEDILDPKRNKFVLKMQSETSV